MAKHTRSLWSEKFNFLVLPNNELWCVTSL